MKEEKIMAAAIGFLMIIVIVALLLKGKMSPIVVLAIVPTITALILGFVPTDLLGIIADGIKTTTSNGILFIFSVIYFEDFSSISRRMSLLKKTGITISVTIISTIIIASVINTFFIRYKLCVLFAL